MTVTGRGLNMTERVLIVSPVLRADGSVEKWDWANATAASWSLSGDDLSVTLPAGLAEGPQRLCVLSDYNETWYDGGVPWTRVRFTLGPSSGDPQFKRGDTNGDGKVDIADAIATLGHLFGGNPAPMCPDAADANDDGQLNIADAIATLGHLFGGTGPLPSPFGACGADPTDDSLPTCVYESCP